MLKFVTGLAVVLILTVNCAPLINSLPSVTLSGPGFQVDSKDLVQAACEPVNFVFHQTFGDIPGIGAYVSNVVGSCPGGAE